MPQFFPPQSTGISPAAHCQKSLPDISDWSEISEPSENQIAYLGEQAGNVWLEIQGQCVAVQFAKYRPPTKVSERGDVSGFSPASRLRLLKMVNRLDWRRAGRSTFLTTTWIDSAGRPKKEQLTQARSDLKRRLEKLANKEFSGLWRTEWEIRQSGRYRGTFMPHVHFLLFGVPFLRQKDVERQWATAIGKKREKVRVDLSEIHNLKQAMYYVSKYIGKCPSGSLVIPSYLNKSIEGRPWGKFRAELLPWADKKLLRTAPGDLADEIRAIAREQWDGVPLSPDAGFTIFGPAAERIKKLIDEWQLTHDGEYDILPSTVGSWGSPV